jgi:hypothetical protein
MGKVSSVSSETSSLVLRCLHLCLRPPTAVIMLEALPLLLLLLRVRLAAR